MNIQKTLVVASSSLMLASLAACSALQPAAIPQVAPTTQDQPNTGVQYHYVTDNLLLPTTQSQADEFALNIDGDAGDSGDNLFGRLLSLLTKVAPGVEAQSTLDGAVDAGKLVSLHVVKADDALNDDTVSWSIVQGQESSAPPAFDGSDEFKVDSAAPVNAPVVGALSAGHFAGGPGEAQVRVFLFNAAVDVDLIGLRLEADINAQGCSNGRLGGGVTAAEFRSKLLPTIAEGLNQALEANPAAAGILLQTFDSDGDGKISVEELEKNPTLMMAASPDLDLLDASGTFNPGQDGQKDSYSMGLGFTCVPAVFEAVGD